MIESEAIRSYPVVPELISFIEVSGFRSAFFAHASNDLNETHQNLESVLSLIDNSAHIKRFLQAPVLRSMISSQQSEMRALVSAALTSSDSVTGSIERIQNFLQSIESQLMAVSRTQNDGIVKDEARIAFAMGLTIYGDRIGKPNSAFGSLHADDFHSAARFFWKACELGVKEAYRHLGDLYYEGHGVEICYSTAVELYRKGVARKDAAAKYKLAWCYEHGHGVQKNHDFCLRLFREAVDEGSPEAMKSLGFLKLHGKLVPCDYSGAYRLLKKAEKKGVLMAKESIAVCYDRGIGADRDPVKAFQLCRECFDGGLLSNTILLANCYDTGDGVKKDPRKATKVLERCVNSGTWFGDFFKAYFGLRLIQGRGVEKDIPRGKAIILDSTKSGSAISWNALGDCFRHGIGFRRDIRKAKEFYKKAIETKNGVQGVVASYEAIGEIFEYGDGVTPSIVQANKYYMAAADRLSPIGQWKIAIALENGIGVKKSIQRAVYYFGLCANSGNMNAQRKSVMYYTKGHGVERPRGYIREIMEEAARGGSKEAKK